MESPVLEALYNGDRAGALEAAKDRELDVFEAAALGRSTRLAELLESDPALSESITEDGFTPLHLAAFFGADRDTAVALLEAGADPDEVAPNGSGLRPINSAAAAGNREVVAVLLDRGADVHAAQRGGYTALHSAAARGDLELIELLLDAGADPALESDDGETAAAIALERGHEQAARRLA